MAPPKVKPFAGRVSMPRGYVLGRASHGDGPPELLDARQLDSMGIGGSARANQVAQVTGFGFVADGLMLNHELIGSGAFHRDVTFTDGLAGTIVTSLVPAHADAAFEIVAPDVSHIPTVVGHITFLAGMTTALVSWVGSSFTLSAGNPVSLYAPTPADTTLGFVTGIVMGKGAL